MAFVTSKTGDSDTEEVMHNILTYFVNVCLNNYSFKCILEIC